MTARPQPAARSLSLQRRLADGFHVAAIGTAEAGGSEPIQPDATYQSLGN
jgi:hypothetical protein